MMGLKMRPVRNYALIAIYEAQCTKRAVMTYTNSEGPDQTLRMRSLMHHENVLI